MTTWDQQQQLEEQQQYEAVTELRKIQQRVKMTAMLCGTDADWLDCLRAIAFDMQNWEQEYGAL